MGPWTCNFRLTIPSYAYRCTAFVGPLVSLVLALCVSRCDPPQMTKLFPPVASLYLQLGMPAFVSIGRGRVGGWGVRIIMTCCSVVGQAGVLGRQNAGADLADTLMRIALTGSNRSRNGARADDLRRVGLDSIGQITCVEFFCAEFARIEVFKSSLYNVIDSVWSTDRGYSLSETPAWSRR